MTHLVDDHPLVKAVDERLADLERRRREFEERVAPLVAEDAAAEEAYVRAVDAALLEGAPMPDPPVRKIPLGRDVEHRAGFMVERQQLTEERRQAMAAAYPDVVDQVRSRSAKLVKSARPNADKFIAAMAELAGLLGDVKTCRTAKNAEETGGHGNYHDTPLTVEAFLQLVLSGDDPVDILDLAGDRPAPSRTSGMTLGDLQQLLSA